MRGQALAGLHAALGGAAAEVAGVTLFHKEDTEIGVFPAISLLDVAVTQCVVGGAAIPQTIGS